MAAFQAISEGRQAMCARAGLAHVHAEMAVREHTLILLSLVP